MNVDMKYKYLIFDVETWCSDSFAFGVIWDPEAGKYTVYRDPLKMRRFFESLIVKRTTPKIKYRILAHNTAYDMNWIFGNYEIYFAPRFKMVGKKRKYRRYTHNNISRQGRFYRAHMYNVEFLDTYNLFSMKLEKPGEVVGFPKLSMPDKFMNTVPTDITSQDIEYCVRDCEVTWKIYLLCEKWVKDHGGELKLTIASCGMSILKNKNPCFKDWLKKMNADYKLAKLDDKFDGAYSGGRSEVYRTEIHNGYYYDVNSLYPSVMVKEYRYPDPMRLRMYHGKVTKSLLDKYEGYGYVTVCIPEMNIPPLIYTRESDNKKIYPYGTFTGKWCFPELRLLLKMGGEILETHECVISPPIPSPFHDYVISLYNERKKQKKEGNPNELITKLYLNAGGYGKLAMRSFTNHLVRLEEAKSDDWGKEVMYDGEIYINVTTEKERSRQSIMCLPSYVTSYARCRLYEYMEQCDFNVVYCDTDSCITNVSLDTSDLLGEMRLEGVVKYGSFLSRKDYYIKWDDDRISTKRKGVPARSVFFYRYDEKGSFNISPIDLERKRDLQLLHDSDAVSYTRIVKSREAIRRGLKASHVITQEKERRERKDNGRVWGVYVFDELLGYSFKENDVSNAIEVIK